MTDPAVEHHSNADPPVERTDVDAPDAPAPRAPAPEQATQGMIPARERRRTQIERGSMRVLATGGIIGLATALGAVLGSQDVDGWIIGLAVGLSSVTLAAILWSSRQL
jgi:hypothetical protein